VPTNYTIAGQRLKILQYASEIMPTCVRAAGVASGYAIFNVIVIVLVQVTPLAIEKVSWRYFLTFLLWDCIAVVVYYFFYPETKNTTVSDSSEHNLDAADRNSLRR
jgi:amino acid permease